MTKKEYMEALERGLARLPREEARKSLAYYAEMIDDRTEEGMGEEEAVAAMEAPDKAAERILYDTPLKVLAQTRQETKPKHSVLVTVLLICGSPVWLPVLCAGISVVVAVYAAVWAALVSLIAGFAATVVTGVALATYGIFGLSMRLAYGLALIGGGLIAAGIGLMLLYAGCLLAMRLGKGTVWSLKRLFIGRRHAA